MKTKCLKVDAVKREVSEVWIEDGEMMYKRIAAEIGNGCDTITVPIILKNEDALYLDDEALLRNVEFGFAFTDDNNEEWLFVNSGVLIGGNEDGESVDVLSTVASVQKRVRWLTPSELARELYSQLSMTRERMEDKS